MQTFPILPLFICSTPFKSKYRTLYTLGIQTWRSFVARLFMFARLIPRVALRLLGVINICLLRRLFASTHKGVESYFFKFHIQNLKICYAMQKIFCRFFQKSKLFCCFSKRSTYLCSPIHGLPFWWKVRRKRFYWKSIHWL